MSHTAASPSTGRRDGGCGRAGPRYYAAAAAVLLAVHGGLVAWEARGDSPTWDEVGHFAAGVSHWENGDFALYRVNPPLVRLLACLPVVLSESRLDVGPYLPDVPGASPFIREEFARGQDLAQQLGPRYFRLVTLARWAVLPLSLVGGWVCYLWAADLYGKGAGLFAVALWTFCPNLLAYGHLIVPDAGAAALGVAAGYLFWRWLKHLTWRRAVAAGLVLGLAELTKTTWLLLFVLWPIAWFAYRLLGGGAPRTWRPGREGLQLALALALAVWVINLGYGYEGSFRRLGAYTFGSSLFTGAPVPPPSDTPELRPHPDPGNRFAGTWLGRLPVPLPSNYVRGIDFVKWEFELKYPSYLRGEWRLGGWWYYYLYALLIKVPAGTWALLALATGASVVRRGDYSAPLRDELLLLLPAATVLVLVSSQTGYNHHARYVLPALPFAFIWISKVARSVRLGHRAVGAAAGLALGASVVSSLWAFPHSMSYFNEFVGGPRNGHWHLGNSNTDWGQDLLYLKKWYDRHPEARPLYVAYDLPLIDPRMAGIDYQPPPAFTEAKPGWYALSVNRMHSATGELKPFLDLTPVDFVGYSTFIYRLSPEDAARLRGESPGQKGAPDHGAAAIRHAD